ncbi:MAG: HAD-IC family P-type ATPase, partial [Moorella sp. (in: Bacteria)]|nr:HAD-IC family P-type ATPase [Moorella sp. (in: firmicutes)]
TSLTHADTLLLINGWGLKVNVRAGSFSTFFDNAPDAAAALLFTALRQNSHPLADLFAPGPAGKQEITVEMEAAAVPDIILESKEEAILLGRAEFLQTRGISVAPGVLKARRLATLGEIPLFLARGGRLAAVAGIICRPTAETALALQKLSLNGIKIMVAAAQPGFYRPLERETGLAVFPLQDAQSLLDGLRAAGETVVVAGGENDPELRVRADVAVCFVQNMPAGAPVTPGIFFPRPDLEKLEQLFDVSLSTARRERENVALTALFNSLGLLLGVSGRLAPVPASLFNNLISLLVLLNSYRLLFFPGEGPPARRGRPAPKKNLFTGEGEKETAAGLPVTTPAGETGISFPGGRTATGGAPRPDRPGAGRAPGAWPWPALEADEVLRLLHTSAAGLTREEAGRRLARYGLNQLPAVSPPGFLARVLNQFKNFLVQTLFGSGVLCFFLGEIADSLAILAILAFNALLGALQEHRAEDALRALKEMTVPLARVKRDGEWRLLPSPLLVPGDILWLAAGDGVPADARILQAASLQVNEAALTGEAYPVNKESTTLPGCVTLIDCHNMVFLGTTVSRGRATAVVTATGRETELGKIAGMLADEETGPTPLQHNLTVVGKKVLAGSLAVSGLVFLAGVLRRQPPLSMFLTGISLAVAAIPEGLPAIVTVALAAGVHRMARENALVRRLAAVENIGGVTVICTDKTGTLTKNEQVVQTVVCADGSRWERGADGVLAPAGARADKKALLFLLAAGVLAGNAWREQGKMSGDPLEKGILLTAAKAGLPLPELHHTYRLAAENPFDAERRYMSMIYQHHPAKEFFSFVKGAPEVVGERCTSYLTAGGPAPFTGAARRYFAAVNSRLAARALRVLAVAYRPLAKPGPADGKPGPEAENDLIFLGLLGMFDPPRPEVRAAIRKCRRAGVKVVMITGDQRNTALAVGRMLGLAQTKTQVYTGSDLENLNDAQLAEIVREGRIFARVLPAHKLRLVKAFRQQGERVAMIGDGVNDAPAVKEADVGLAMGRTGTDVTKEAADIILTDDNFATVVAAVEQGRGIYDNVLRSVRYLLATNLGEIFLVLFSVLAGLPLPLLPIQLLWLNLLGDSFPALALSLDRPARDVLDRPPREPQSTFADRDYIALIAARGLAIGLCSLGAYWWGLKGGDLVRARTLALTSLTASQLLHALDCQPERPAEKAGRRLIGAAVSFSGGLLLGALYYPPAAGLFKTAPPGLRDWLAVGLSAGLSNLLDKLLRPVLPKTGGQELGIRVGKQL